MQGTRSSNRIIKQNTDINLNKADKGSTTVVMNKTDKLRGSNTNRRQT